MESGLGTYFFAALISLLVVVFSLLPSYLLNFPLLGRRRARQLLHAKIERNSYIFSKFPFWRESYYKEVSRLRKDKCKILLYYTSKMIPEDEMAKRKFNDTIERLKIIFGISGFLVINDSSDMIRAVKEYNIDTSTLSTKVKLSSGEN